jgi:hypothetical protein
MTVRAISREAYIKHLESGKALTQWQKIYNYLCANGGAFTRAEIAEVTGIRLSSVCGRVNELLRANMIAEFERRRCDVTGEPAHPVGLPERAQRNLFH